MDFPRAQDLFRTFRDEVVSRADRLTLNAVDRDGTDANIMGYGAAMIGEEVIGQLASVEEGRWLDSAFGVKLDRLAWDRYQLLRKPAAPAFVNLAFSTATAAPAAFSIPPNTKVRSADGREFLTTVAVTYPAGSVGPVYVTARSALSGIDQNVKSETLKSLTSAIVGAPAGLTVTNPKSAAGGANAESDDQFKARIRRFWVSARRGTKGALEAGALAVPGVTSALAIEGLTGPGYPNRQTSLVISDDFTDALVLAGVSTPTYDARSQAFAKVVFNALDEYRVFGMSVSVMVAAVRLVSVALRLHFQAGVADPDTLALYARSLIVQHINELAPGEVFDPADALDILRTVPGLTVMGDEIASPAGTINPSSPYEVLRSSLAFVSVDPQALLSPIPPDFV